MRRVFSEIGEIGGEWEIFMVSHFRRFPNSGGFLEVFFSLLLIVFFEAFMLFALGKRRRGWI